MAFYGVAEVVVMSSISLKIKVVPGASRTELSGWLGDMLKVRVAAPPEKGRANAAVEALLAQVLGVSAESVRITSGKGSQLKRVRIDGVAEAELRRKLGAADRLPEGTLQQGSMVPER